MSLFLRLFFGCLLQLLPFSMLCLYPFHGHFRINEKKVQRFTLALLTLLSSIFACAVEFLHGVMPQNHALFDASNLLFMLCLIPCLGWFLYIVDDIWSKRLFVFLFTLTAAVSMTSLNNVLCTVLMRGIASDYMPYRGIALSILFAVTVVTIPLLMLLLKKAFIPLSDSLAASDYGWLCGLSCILFLTLACGLIPIEYTYVNNPMTLYLYAALQLSVFLIYFVVFRIFSISKKKAIAERHLAQLETQTQMQTEQYRHLMEQISETKRARHDARHHFMVIKEYLLDGQQAELLDYVNAQIHSIDGLTIEQYSENELINVLTSHYAAQARKAKVKMTARISCEAELHIPGSDLSVLLGNLLENALYAASHAEGGFRTMTLNIIQQGNMLAIALDNGFDGVVNRKGDAYLSTKPGHEGFGLDSIAKIASRYGGAAEFHHDGKTFKASVMLQNNG